jgi:hypothetical protein
MRVLVARFFNHMISENVQAFWAALQRGEFITDAAEAAGTYRKQGARWVVRDGGVRPRRGRDLQGRVSELRRAGGDGTDLHNPTRLWGGTRRSSQLH